MQTRMDAMTRDRSGAEIPPPDESNASIGIDDGRVLSVFK